MTADAIVLEHVHVTYPGAATEALNDICLRVPSGQHLCILGGNGSGKSTLLQLVNVLTMPTAAAPSFTAWTRATRVARLPYAAGPRASFSILRTKW